MKRELHSTQIKSEDSQYDTQTMNRKLGARSMIEKLRSAGIGEKRGGVRAQIAYPRYDE